MKIALLSDTHMLHRKIWNKDLKKRKDIDLIIHAGDVCSYGTKAEFYDFAEWCKELPIPVIMTPGNHEVYLERDIHNNGLTEELAKELLNYNITYLLDSFTVFNGLKIYGSPWQPRFFDWAFNLDRGEPLAAKWRLIPNDTDILITHGPPFGLKDLLVNGEKAGCKDLRKKVEEIKPKLHVFGHIHFSSGVAMKNETLYVNAANLGEDYKYHHKPTIVTLTEGKLTRFE